MSGISCCKPTASEVAERLARAGADVGDLSAAARPRATDPVLALAAQSPTSFDRTPVG